MKKYIIMIGLILSSFGFFAVRANASTSDWVDVDYIEINIDINMSEMNAEKTFNLFNMLYYSNFVFYDGSLLGQTLNHFTIYELLEYDGISVVVKLLVIEINLNYIVVKVSNGIYTYEAYEYNDNIKLNGAIEITRGVFNAIFSDGENFGYNVGLDVGYNNGYTDGYTDGDLQGYINGYNQGVLQGENQGFIDGYNDGLQRGKEQGFNDGYNSGYNDGESVGYNSGYGDGENAGYIDGYDYGYNNGYDLGYNEGYEIAITDGETQFGLSTLLAGLFGGLGTLLSIQLLPNITIGMIIAVPVVFGIISFILGRRGGKGD